ncbi:MAG: T9SS type A sorting domain-containing protein [Bacteroidota bacterium]
MKPLLIILALFCACFEGLGQSHSPPQWVVYDTSNSGIPDNNIICISFDSIGRKWIGTYHGIAIFDNFSWVVYDTSNSGLPGDIITCIAFESNGVAWIGIYHDGLARFDGTNWTVYTTYNSGLIDNFPVRIAIDSLDNKWIATHDGLQKFDGTNWTTFRTANSGIPQNWLEYVTIDKSGSIWVATSSEGVAKYDGTNWTWYWLVLSSPMVRVIAVDSNNLKWLGSCGDGLEKFNDSTYYHYTYNIGNSGIPTDFMTDVAIDKFQTKWIGSYYGLTKFNDTSWVVYNTTNSGIPTDRALKVSVDDKGNKWIGTELAGLVVFNENGVTVGMTEHGATSAEKKITIIPNPVQDKAKVIIPEQQSGKKSVLRLYNELGKLVLTIKTLSSTCTLNRFGLAPGVYFLVVTSEDGGVLGSSKVLIY